MATIIICTPGGASDNSYVTLAQANTYFSLTLDNDSWVNGWSDDEKERALIDATNDIEGLGGTKLSLLSPARPRFPGTPYHSGSTNGAALQALHFPLSDDATTISGVVTLQVPPDLKAAVCEQALWLLEKRDAPDMVDYAGLKEAGVSIFNADGIYMQLGGKGAIPPRIGPLAWQKIAPFVQRSYGIG